MINANDAIIALLSSRDLLTVGELSELFNKTFSALAMPRGELSKRVSTLTNEGLISVAGHRICTIGGRRVMVLTTRKTDYSTDLISRAKRDLDNAQRKYNEALAYYNGLMNRDKVS